MTANLVKDHVTCANCRGENERAASVCRKCGARLYIACHHCGARNERVARRCLSCNRRRHRNWWLHRRKTVVGRFSPLEILSGSLGVCLLIFLLVRMINNIGSPSASDDPAPAVDDSPVKFGGRR